MGNNIIFNKKLEDYNKKYRNGRYRLLKYTKKEVEQYDKLANQTFKAKNYLLKGRKWTLIGDTYYEIPRAPRMIWLRNINVGAKVATCALLGGAVAGGAGYGIYAAITNKQPVKPDPGPGPQPEPVVEREVVIDSSMAGDLKISNKETTPEGIKCTIDVIDQTAFINGISEVKIGETTLVEETDYSFNLDTKQLIINKSALDAHKGKIIIKPSYSHDATEEVFTEQINTATTTAQTECTNHQQQTVSGTSMCGGGGEDLDLQNINYEYSNNYWTVTAVVQDRPDILLAGGAYHNIMAEGGLYSQLKVTFGDDNVFLRINNPEGLIITCKNQYGEEIRKYIFNNKGYLVYYLDKDEQTGSQDEYAIGYANQTTQIKKENEHTGMSFSNPADLKVSISGDKTALEQSSPTTLDIPESVLDNTTENLQYTVTSIADKAYNRDNQKTPPEAPFNFEVVNIPSTITSIGESAFANNTKIKEINFGNNSQLESIGEQAFSGCSDLTFVHIPSKVQTIGAAAFKFSLSEEQHDKGIKTVVIDSQAIADFDKPSALSTYLYQFCTKIYVKNTINVAENSYINQFYDRKDSSNEYEGYVLYEKIPVLDYFTFTKKSGSQEREVSVKFNNDGTMDVPTNLTIPSSIDGTLVDDLRQNSYKVTDITVGGFDAQQHPKCANIESIQLGDNLTGISSTSFSNLTNLKSINIPTSVTNIGPAAFSNCNNPDFEVTFEDPNNWNAGEDIPAEDLQNKKTAAQYLTDTYCSVGWSKGQTPPVIEDLVFNKIDGTETYSVRAGDKIQTQIIVIPEKYNNGDVVAIEENGFKDKGITSITLPKTINKIGKNAFSGCTMLTQESSAGVIFNSECQSGWKQIGETYTETLDVSNPKYNADYLTSTEEGSWRATGIERTVTGNLIELDYSDKGFNKSTTTKFQGGETWEIVADYSNVKAENPVSIICMSLKDSDSNLLYLSEYISSFSCTYTPKDGKATTLNPSYKTGDSQILYFNVDHDTPVSYNSGKISMTITFIDPLPQTAISSISFYTPND